MKKTKLLISVIAIPALGYIVIPLSSCSCNSQNQQFTVKFDTQGGSTIEDVKVNKDSTITRPTDPTKTGFVFGGWFLNKECTADKEFDFATKITSDLTLYAKWATAQEADLANLKKINKILESASDQNTMSGALATVKASGIDVEKLAVLTAGGQYAWDQTVKKFIIYNITTEQVVFAPEGYTFSGNKWELWIMVAEGDFDEYCEYSQYLKASTTNALTKTNYSFISGFDCGDNVDVKNVHYFYEKMETQKAKGIIINTNSKTTNVDVSAWDGAGTEGDVVTHYGQMCELTVVSNYEYIENGNAISATVFDGEIKIHTEANIVMTYVRDNNVILTDYKHEGTTIDEIYTDSSDATIKTNIEGQGYTIAEDHDIADTVYQAEKETKIGEQGGTVQHVFTVTGGEQNEYYESFSAIAAVSNASENPEYFEGKTIVLNKDYDMSVESTSWISICNYDDDTGAKAFKGTVDGHGHTILNFNLNASTGNPGLINSNAGSVKNLNFKNCSLNNSGGRTSLVAVWNGAGDMEFSNLNFYNCNVTSTKSNGFAFGYILNSGNDATFKNIYVDEECWVKGNGSGVVQTGFVSQVCNGVNSLVFEDCELHLKVDSYYASGGYVGQLGAVNDAGCLTVTFKNCTSSGDIVVSQGTGGIGPMVGGFIGARQNNTSASNPSTTTFDHCTNYSKVYATDQFGSIDSIGGFIGYGNNPKESGSKVDFIDCVNEGEIGKENTETSYIPNHAGGFFGRTNANENLAITFTRCINKGYINASTAGHFMGLIDQQTEASLANKKCVNCSYTGSLRDGSTRVKITDEPE